MSVATVATKLKTIIDTVSASVLPQKFSYNEGKPASFPAAIIQELSHTNGRLDTQYNILTQRWSIQLIFANAESQEAADKWRTLTDTIFNEFSKDDHQTLTGSAVSVLATDRLAPKGTDAYGQPVIVYEILLEIKTLRDITT